jgi:hypothetical protein
MNQIKKFIFTTNGVMVMVPEQVNGIKVKVKGVSYKAKPNQKLKQVNFEFKREINEIDIVEFAPPNLPVQNFDPPIEVRIYYTDSDVNYAGSKKRIKMAFWDGNMWIPFTAKHQFHIFEYPYKNWAGFGIAIIREWIDPPIALGK